MEFYNGGFHRKYGYFDFSIGKFGFSFQYQLNHWQVTLGLMALKHMVNIPFGIGPFSGEIWFQFRGE